MSENQALIARVDFDCQQENCGETIKFNLMDLENDKGVVQCEHCHSPYKFGKPFLKKLKKLRKLIFAIQEAEEILDDTNVAVATPGGEVKLPYRLLLTRMNALIKIKGIDFNFRVEPLNDDTFR